MNDLGMERFAKLDQVYNKYTADKDYESFRDSIFEIFQANELFPLLRTMPMLVENNYRIRFLGDIDEFIVSRQDN